MTYAIKTEIRDTQARAYVFPAQKTMYGGKQIAVGDTVFLFASENEGGPGLIARGSVTAATAVQPKPNVGRQTPRVNISVRVDARARRPLGRTELKKFTDWKKGGPKAELNFKFYRQATNKIVGVSEETAKFLAGFF